MSIQRPDAPNIGDRRMNRYYNIRPRILFQGKAPNVTPRKYYTSVRKRIQLISLNEGLSLMRDQGVLNYN